MEELPPGHIFVIPIRLDECEIPYEELKKFHYQDFFPDWYEGLKKILIPIESKINERSKDNTEIEKVQEEQKNYNQEREIKQQQKRTSKLKFISEKRTFVGRREYIDNKIKNVLKEYGSRISIIGPGGSGKSQLAFKALHQYYENDKMIDLLFQYICIQFHHHHPH